MEIVIWDLLKTFMFYIIGLGNPGDEYKNTRHNMGRIILDKFAEANDFSEWVSDKKTKALLSDGKIGKTKVKLIEPETFMNKSGVSAKALITSKKKAEKLIVIYDDLDMPLGSYKIAFNRGSGGHKGVESIRKAIKTKEFIRIRVGVLQTTPTGKLKKPKGEKKVLDFIMKEFKKDEVTKIKKMSKTINEALETIVKEGRVMAMNRFN